MHKKVSGRAPINIALIKYWGKKDEVEVIPYQPSISLSLDIFETITTIQTYDGDTFKFELNHEPHPKTQAQVEKFLKHFTDENTLKKIYIQTHNTGPTAAGLASSASGFAALAVTANHFFETHYPLEKLAEITRKGSGSAIRSLLPGCVMWDIDGLITPISFPFDDVLMGIIIINGKEKSIGSTEAMKLSVLTSPLYPDWVKQSFIDRDRFLDALKNKDFDQMGIITELNALHMHEVARQSKPEIKYLTEESYKVILEINKLRKDSKISLYATMDAGPNVKILTRISHQKDIVDHFKTLGYDILWSGVDSKGACIIDA
jgi:diphosphomevalonate decarboxylase